MYPSSTLNQKRSVKLKPIKPISGKVVWTDGNIKTARDLTPAETETLDSNLEF